MSRFPLRFLLLMCLLAGAGCSERKRSDPDAEEWADIDAMAEGAPVAQLPSGSGTEPTNAVTQDTDGEFEGFKARLKQMKSVTREAGQTMLTGKRLTFDRLERFVQMDGNVFVDDDHGQLRAESMTGRFSLLNEVELVEASGDVSVVSGAREARADAAVYNYDSGTVQMKGQASLSESGNRLSGERISFWLKGERKMVCEPNAVLVISGQSGLGTDDIPEDIGLTEIRAKRVVYDESKGRADALGGVQLRNPQVAMDCGEIHVFLKDNNKIDWIEAVAEVIIQSEDRKALADRAVYEADEGKFTLEGHPMVKQGPNVMTGDRIFFWHKTRSVLCEPNGRVLYYYNLDAETRARFPEDVNE